jgi:hypothetical protein
MVVLCEGMIPKKTHESHIFWVLINIVKQLTNRQPWLMSICIFMLPNVWFLVFFSPILWFLKFGKVFQSYKIIFSNYILFVIPKQFKKTFIITMKKSNPKKNLVWLELEFFVLYVNNVFFYIFCLCGFHAYHYGLTIIYSQNAMLKNN